MKGYSVTADPGGEVYAALVIHVGGKLGARFSFVVRDGLGTSSTFFAVVARLEEFLVRRVRTDRWPGTQLLGHEAELFTYRVNAESMSVLVACAESLYSWQQPELPEDLAFYYADGSVLLESISHESDAVLYLEDDELQRVPVALGRMLVRDATE